MVPTVTAFRQRFIENYAQANNKPSEVATKQMILSLHIVPELGHLRLDQVGPEEIEGYKARS